MAEIPPDIITLVLREIYYLRKVDFSAEHQPDSPTLRSCALVNSVWIEAAQSLLFKSVVCNPSFANTILEGNSALLKYVRIIDLKTPNDENALEEFGKLVGLALDRCPFLYELVWRGEEQYALSDIALSDIRARGASVRSLRIHWRDPSTNYYYRLPTCFPSLRFLSITTYANFDSHFRAPTPPSDFLAGLSLFELRLSGGSDSVLKNVCQSQHSLQVLEIPSILDLGILKAVRPHLVNLRSLRLKRFTEVERSLLETCTKLEELMVVIEDRSPGLPVPLPSPLKHLLIMIAWGGMGSHATTFVSSVTQAVTRPYTLRSIRLRGPTWNLNEDLSALRSACEDRDVELVVKSFAPWPDEMCVKASTGCNFPRRRSISNFTLMN